jgi:6-phosphogluconolactonase (cycloisomerase 2 family)
MKRWIGRAAGLLGLWALGLTTGCAGFFVYPGSTGTGGNGGGGSSSADYVYVANATNDSVAGFAVGTGTLTALSGSPYALGYSPTAVAVNPADSILFVASSGGIYTYSIGSNGVLTLLSSGVTSGLNDVVSMAVSPDGQWLFALDGIATANVVTVYEFEINSNGALTPETSGGVSFTGSWSITAPASPVTPPLPSAISAATVTSGVYVFVALGTGGDLVIPFNTGSGLQLTPTQYTVPPGSSIYTSDNALAVSNSILYVARANSTSAGSILAYNVGSGSLSLVGQAATGVQPTSVVVNQAGTDLYVANRTDTTISGFSIGSSGAPTALATYSSGLGTFPVGLAVDNSGDYLIAVANGGSPELTMYSYDATTAGKLDFSTSAVTGSSSSGGVALATTR